MTDALLGYVWMAGDLLGPSVNGLDKLIRMPYGCGEQNMLNFAPNIYIMKYLETAGQATADIVDKSERYMMAGKHVELYAFHVCCVWSAPGKRHQYYSLLSIE